MNFTQIVNDSKLAWLELDIEFPYNKMYEEAKAIKHLFVKHRDQDGAGGYRHKGWRSLCIHGIDSHKTNHYEQYGYTSNKEAPYKWTEIADMCPVTTKFFKETFPYKEYFRLRFMLLEPRGFITPHVDTDERKLSPINIALNHPKGCLMKMEGHEGYVPFKPGSAMLLDVGNTHAYINKSDEDRYHIIVHGVKTKQFEELVVRSYEKING